MPEHQGPPERREAARQKMVLPLGVHLLSPDGQPTSRVDGVTRDLSNRGVFFWAQGKFAPNQLLRLDLEVPVGSVHKFLMTLAWEVEVVRIDARAGEIGVAVRTRQLEVKNVLPGSVGSEN